MISENSSDGYILEVGLVYPEELHELHKDYQLTSEKLEVSHNMLSKYCSNIPYKYDIKIGSINKLVLNLGNKNKYALHCRNLYVFKILM